MEYLVTDKLTRKTYLYTPDDGSGISICAAVGHIDCNWPHLREWNAKGELIRSEILPSYGKVEFV